MYKDIGDKIKAIAVTGCILGIFGCFIIGVPMIAESDYGDASATIGWIVIIAGSLALLAGSFCLYGFGELIEKTCANNAALTQIEREIAEMKARFPMEENKSTPSVSASTNNANSQDAVQLAPVVVESSIDVSGKNAIFNNKPLQTLIDSPIRVEEVALLTDSDNNGVWGNIRFFNQSKKDILAILVRLEAFNAAGEEVPLDKPRFVYQNLRIASGEMYGDQSAFVLPAIVRRINVVPEKVLFENNEVWEAKDAGICSIQEPTELVIPQTHYDQIMKKISQRIVDPSYVAYQYAEGSNYWQCTCGAINSRERSQCVFCPNTQDQKRFLTQKSIDHMVQTIDAELSEQLRRAEQARFEEQMRREEQANPEKNERAILQKGMDYPHPLKYYNGVCPNCGFRHHNNRSSCAKCGSRFASEDALDSLFEIPVHCPKCGKKLSEGVKFCYFCGAKVE